MAVFEIVTDRLKIIRVERHYEFSFENQTCLLYPTRRVYKFEKYAMPQMTKYLKPIFEKHAPLLFELWCLWCQQTVEENDFKEQINKLLDTVFEDLLENVRARELDMSSANIKGLPVTFDDEENIVTTAVSDFLKLTFPILLLEKYPLTYWEIIVEQCARKNSTFQNAYKKLIQVLHIRVNHLFKHKRHYFTAIQYYMNIDDSVFFNNLFNTLLTAFPYAYDTKNTIGYLLSVVDRYVYMVFLSVFTKEIQHHENFEATTQDTGVERKFKSYLLDLDIANYVSPFLTTMSDFSEEKLILLKEKFARNWYHLKFIIPPYLITVGYDYGQITMSTSLFVVAYYLYYLLKNKFSTLAKLCVGEFVKSNQKRAPITFNSSGDLLTRKLMKSLSHVEGHYRNLLTDEIFYVEPRSLQREYQHYLKYLKNAQEIQFGYLYRLKDREFAVPVSSYL